MLFLNPLLLIGLLGVAVPLLLHLRARMARRPVGWGAMRFLEASMSGRARRIELEDALLMGARCALAGCLAFALARPFVPPGARVPWVAVLPLAIAATVAVAVAGACWGDRRRRLLALAAAGTFAMLASAAVLFERSWILGRLGGQSAAVALVIDASTSMRAPAGDGGSRFDRALAEAREIIVASDEQTSFAIVLAAASPTLLTAQPTASRTDLQRALATAECSDGGLALPEALLAAGEILRPAGGSSRAILITDGAAGGWGGDRRAAWEAARDAFGATSTKPQLIVRTVPAPTATRNLAVVAVESERGAPTAGRPAELRVDLLNTGSEAVTPGRVTLRIGNELLEKPGVGQLLPGEGASVRFDHQFAARGAYVVTASALVDDDLPADNTRDRAFAVGAGPAVLVVDGRASAKGFARAAAFIELALAPDGGEGAAVVVPAAGFPDLERLQRFDAVVLAAVPRLPAGPADLLDAWVAAGGGLLVAPDDSADPDFYNSWPPTAAVSMGDWRAEAVLSASSIDHRVIHEGGDLASVQAGGHRAFDAAAGVEVVAAFAGGAPAILRLSHGDGGILVSALPLDNSASNLPSRSSFVPLVHELIGEVAAAPASATHLGQGSSIELAVPGLADGSYGVLDPTGEARAAESNAGVLKVEGTAHAGVYEVDVPAALREPLTGRLTTGGTLPFTIARPETESQLAAIGIPDAGAVSETFEVLQAPGVEQAAAALEGSPFGSELWRVLALAALALLVAEPALARWVTRSRKTGEHIGVDFDASGETGRVA